MSATSPLATVRSFDVFDTVVVRRCGPYSVHRAVAERLLASGMAQVRVEAIVAARVQAERQANAWLGRHADLPTIWQRATAMLQLPSYRHELFVEVEQEVDLEVTAVVPGLPEELTQARADGQQVIFLSDTPHSEEFLTRLLAAGGLFVDGDRVFTSSQRGVSKSSGGLFTLVSRELEVSPDRFLHMGDNWHSDVAAARAEGWSARLRADGAQSRYEQLLEECDGPTAGLSSHIAGAARLARLRARTRGVDKAVAEVAAGVVAPLLLGFAMWLAAQAAQRGLQRFYFVARDGEAILEAARPILSRLVPHVECRYLYGSRQAWNLAASAGSKETLADWLQVKQDVTLRAALVRYGLDVEEVRELCDVEYVELHKPDAPLSARARVELARIIQQSPLRELVRTAGETALASTTAYLEQEGLFDGTPSALVDVGWSGHAARSLDHLVRHKGGDAPEHLFVGITEKAGIIRKAPDAPSMAAWLFDLDLGLARAEPVNGFNVVIEMFLAGTQGRNTGYTQLSNSMQPILNTLRNRPVLDWGIAVVREIVQDVIRNVTPRLGEHDLHLDLATPVWRSLSAFWSKPTQAEALAWGSFPWEEETWPPYYPVAQPLRTEDVVRRLARGDRRLRQNYSWRAGSALLSGQPWKALLQARAWQEEHPGELRRLRRRAQLAVAARFRN